MPWRKHLADHRSCLPHGSVVLLSAVDYSVSVSRLRAFARSGHIATFVEVSECLRHLSEFNWKLLPDQVTRVDSRGY